MAGVSAGTLDAPNAPPPLWLRLTVAMSLALGVTLLLRSEWTTGFRGLLFRTATIAFVAVLVFTLFERLPRRLPAWLPRWVLQVVGTGVAMPVTTLSIYLLTTPVGAPPFWLDEERTNGFIMLTFLSILIAPWTALGSLLRQREAFARHQALAFALERSELERRALDARLQLLQAQVAPHFLFNTLANVQALVDTGSPRASDVLRSLIAYLRAAVPRMSSDATTLGDELDLVRAYLEVMRMRMPDRLTFEIHADEAARGVRLPPITLLTLVENAVRHGIDSSEAGGRIEVETEIRGDRCSIRVSDTGAGLGAKPSGSGMGLATLRERLELSFGGRASLRITGRLAGGVCAELDLPVDEVAP
jgi:hypothetical protein